MNFWTTFLNFVVEILNLNVGIFNFCVLAVQISNLKPKNLNDAVQIFSEGTQTYLSKIWTALGLADDHGQPKIGGGVPGWEWGALLCCSHQNRCIYKEQHKRAQSTIQ